VIVVEIKEELTMKKTKKRLNANNKDDKMLMLFLSCFNLLDDYTKLTSGQIRKCWYEMEDRM
jgi:hypothetical protein